MRRLVRAARRRLTPKSFRGQIVVSTVLLMTAVMLVVGVGVQILLAFTAQRDIDSVLDDRATAVVAAIDASSEDGPRLEVPDALLEPGVRVYDGDGTLVAGTIEHEARDRADDLATTTTARNVDVNDEVRLRAVPFTTATGQHGVVVVSQETTPYERAEMYALFATIGIGVLVIAISAGIANRVTSQALRPVTRMAERATDWSEHDLSHRFELGQADNELAQLGATLDGLLDRVAMAIRSEQRLTSELAHELRTPLTAIQGSADLALLRGVEDPATRDELEQIAASARVMSEVITTLVDVARDRASAGLASTSYVGDVVDAVRALVPAHLTFVDETDGAEGRIAAPPELVLRMLAPLVDNAAAHARTTVRLGAVDTATSVEVSVADDGAGIDPALRDTLFSVGASGGGGTGLGLGIARRVARSVGGSVDVTSHDQGARFTVSLPRA
ncbi:sensor histidine kinase [Nocardioides mangrovi]|uniref:histidine kinase n=1 Tax=Nocardioides mangrovi TaxID=2874580 RepID=A0ABS7U8K5_9ACTN|nr:HAMP domain-containing sensor histidine kinase [Nocardioides mangrovi]MBZ5737180.1 HAMP domain-containing histidine kinase [Nocardioides mangrovi]